MNSNFKKTAFAIIILAAGIGGMIAINASADDKAEKDEVDTRPTVRVQPATKINYEVIIKSNGEVRPAETTAISAQVSGEVLSWHANFVEGGLVKRGDVLFTIEADQYEAAVLQAESEVSRAQATLIEEQARADVAKREAKNLPSATVTDLYLRKPQLLSAQAGLKSAQSRLKIALRDLDNTQVTAPYDALIVSRDIGVGQFVNKGVQVARLNNVERAEIIFPIAGFDAPFLPNTLVNTPATVVSRGMDKTVRQGIIARDTGRVDQATRMTHLVVEIEDPYSLMTNAPKMKFGTYVEVNFNGQIINNVYKVPQSIVNKRAIWILDDNNQMVSKPVNVVREEGVNFYIDQGIEENDRMVMTLPEYPQNGMAVKIVGEASPLVAKTKQADDSNSSEAQ
jgi:RND family efflux transporter MFP subunit